MERPGSHTFAGGVDAKLKVVQQIRESNMGERVGGVVPEGEHGAGVHEDGDLLQGGINLGPAISLELSSVPKVVPRSLREVELSAPSTGLNYGRDQ
jgi:hypothetical protein